MGLIQVVQDEEEIALYSYDIHGGMTHITILEAIKFAFANIPEEEVEEHLADIGISREYVDILNID